MKYDDFVTREMIETLSAMDTCCVSDAMDRLGIECCLLDIKPVVRGEVICGRAFTVRYVPCGVVKGTVGDFLDDVQEGEIVVIDNAGRKDCTVWGDLMSIASTNKKIGGTVIDGVCRDLPTIFRLQYPIFTKGYYMRTGKDRVEVDAVNVPVAISGIKIKPGDVILGDDSGVLSIPAEYVANVIKVAVEIAAKESIIEKELANGYGLREARAKVKYHDLQTKVNE
jgi:regulator of RNase E activity RraA